MLPKSPRDARTWVVVLNFRTPAATVTAIRSIEDVHQTLSAIVIDNASGDDSVDILRAALPDVRLIVADENRGFSAGCNLGIREALRLGAERVLLLNSDALLVPDALSQLERALADDSRLGIVGPMVVERGDPERVQSLGITYRARSGRMRHRGFGRRRDTGEAGGPREVDGVSGCAMMIRREVFERIGLFEEDYFFGFEDLDFCLRARDAGFLTACVASAVVLHEGSVSIGPRSARKIYFATRNHLLLARRRSQRFGRLARQLAMAGVSLLNLAHVLFSSPVPRRVGLTAFARGVRDYRSGRFGPDV